MIECCYPTTLPPQHKDTDLVRGYLLAANGCYVGAGVRPIMRQDNIE